MNTDNLVLPKGKSESLSVSIWPINAAVGENVQWTSSDSNIASVDKNGKVTAVSKGKAIVTAKIRGRQASCNVIVVDSEGVIVDWGMCGTDSTWVLNSDGVLTCLLYTSPSPRD